MNRTFLLSFKMKTSGNTSINESLLKQPGASCYIFSEYSQCVCML